MLSKRTHAILSVGNLKVGPSMNEKPDILQGMLALMVLKTLVVPGSQHGYGIARRIKQISGDILALNQGSLYLLLLKLEHEGSIVSRWDASENNRRARFYSLTATGRKQLQTETSDWNQTVSDLFNLIVRENGMLAGLLSPPPNTGACSLQTAQQIGHFADGVPDDPRFFCSFCACMRPPIPLTCTR